MIATRVNAVCESAECKRQSKRLRAATSVRLTAFEAVDLIGDDTKTRAVRV
jgi:hypothetical protein